MRNAAYISSTYICELCYNICKIVYETYSNGKGLKIRLMIIIYDYLRKLIF